jgi:hypothetical protein
MMNIFQFHIVALKQMNRWINVTSGARSVCLAISLVVLICGAARVTGAEPLTGDAATTLPSDAIAQVDQPRSIISDPSSQLAGPATQPSSQLPIAPGPSDTDDLRQLIGVHAPGIAPVELPKLPVMSLHGYIKAAGDNSYALLEVVDLNRIFIVKEGTEIPITVQGRISPINQSELTGLGQSSTPTNNPDTTAGQSLIILKIIKVSEEGVLVQAGLSNQTIIIK